MPRFAANISFLFTELPFLDRFEAAANAGFEGVEFHYPFEFDPLEIRLRLDEYGLTPVLMNIRAGNHARGDWGFAGIPGREETFRLCVIEAMEYALEIGIRQINCLAGVKPAEVDVRTCELTLIDNVRSAAEKFAEFDLTLNLEALNTQDVPGFLISNTRNAMRLINEIGAKNVMLQYDCYHMQLMEGALIDTIRRLLPRIGHIQFADAPGRGEPGTGQIDFPALFAHLNALRYKGWVSAEYRPSVRTTDSLAWMKARRSR